jgi:hypothetical protein
MGVTAMNITTRGHVRNSTGVGMDIEESRELRVTGIPDDDESQSVIANVPAISLLMIEYCNPSLNESLMFLGSADHRILLLWHSRVSITVTTTTVSHCFTGLLEFQRISAAPSIADRGEIMNYHTFV